MLQETLVWQGNLRIRQQFELKDLNLLASNSHPPTNPAVLGPYLELLAYVDPSRIPLCLIASAPLRVNTRDDSTQDWFSDVLLHESIPGLQQREKSASGSETTTRIIEPVSTVPWHETSAEQSRIAILARPSDLPNRGSLPGPRVTEVLFFAARKASAAVGVHARLPRTPSPDSDENSDAGLNVTNDDASPQSGEIELRALLLSSDLLSTALQLPLAANSSTTGTNTTTTIATVPPPEHPKQRLTTLFDTATHLRKRSRPNSARSISIAASKGATFDFSISAPTSARAFEIGRRGDDDDPNPNQNSQGLSLPEPRRKVNVRPATSSRSSSISLAAVAGNSRPSSVRGSGAGASAEPALRPLASSSSTATTALGNAGLLDGRPNETVAERNKQTVSRTVMAGMRLCGLVPVHKSSSSAAAGTIPPLSTSASMSAKDAPAETHTKSQTQASQSQTHAQAQPQAQAQRDHDQRDEYKGVYHQVYKGALFAFRREVESEVLGPERVRDVVDRLLGIFCGEVG